MYGADRCANGSRINAFSRSVRIRLPERRFLSPSRSSRNTCSHLQYRASARYRCATNDLVGRGTKQHQGGSLRRAHPSHQIVVLFGATLKIPRLLSLEHSRCDPSRAWKTSPLIAPGSVFSSFSRDRRIRRAVTCPRQFLQCRLGGGSCHGHSTTCSIVNAASDSVARKAAVPDHSTTNRRNPSRRAADEREFRVGRALGWPVRLGQAPAGALFSDRRGAGARSRSRRACPSQSNPRANPYSGGESGLPAAPCRR